MTEILCTITDTELTELLELFEEYVQSDNDTELVAYKAELGKRYGYDYRECSIDAKGHVRKTF